MEYYAARIDDFVDSKRDEKPQYETMSYKCYSEEWMAQMKKTDVSKHQVGWEDTF